MRKKNIFTVVLLAFVLHMPSVAFSQSKPDTEDWILSKLRNHYDKGGNAGIQLFDLKIENGVLIISYIYDHEKGRYRTGEEYVINIKVVKHHIPVWAITEAVYHDGGILINTVSHVDCYSNSYIAKPDGETTSRTTYYTNHDFIKNYDGKKHYTSFQVKLTTTSPEPEDDFLNRFNKALTHLKTFYPKPGKPNETF